MAAIVEIIRAVESLEAGIGEVLLIGLPRVIFLQDRADDIVLGVLAGDGIIVRFDSRTCDLPHQCGKGTMLIGVELSGQSVLGNELVVVRHLRVTDHVFNTVVLFVDHPHVRRFGDCLSGGGCGEQKTRDQAQRLRRHRDVHPGRGEFGDRLHKAVARAGESLMGKAPLLAKPIKRA